jgi:FkbM family methyltransferase
MIKIFRYFRAVLGIFFFSRAGTFTRIFEQTKFDHDFNVSWSQGGEDIALLSIFTNESKGIYIDVGAHHPSRFSVTRHLYQCGWSGLNVEANQELIKEFQIRRPRDKSIVGFVGTPGVRNFHIFSEPAFSTSDLSLANLLVEHNRKLLQTIEVESTPLRNLLDDYFPQMQIDLLNIDAEGSDLDVLMSLHLEDLENGRWPKYLLLETKPPVSHALEAKSVLYAMSHGYIPVLVLPMSTILKSPFI